MKRKMEPVEVELTDDGQIRFSQTFSGDEQSVVVDPDQIDTLVKWLKEARTEADARVLNDVPDNV